MDFYLGFDPGGQKNFGWAVCSSMGSSLEVIATGVADHARGAVDAAIASMPEKAEAIGAGIDAPLFWVEDGKRSIDKAIRNAIKRLGAPFPQGTVQQVNSLRGACLVQGVVVAKLLREHFHDIGITESHPKALLYLLGITDQHRSPADVTIGDLSSYVIAREKQVTSHERDAVLGSVSSWAQHKQLEGWKDLYREEKDPISPFGYKPSYWMPWDLVGQENTT